MSKEPHKRPWLKIKREPGAICIYWEPTYIDFIVGLEGETENRFGYYNKSKRFRLPKWLHERLR